MFIWALNLFCLSSDQNLFINSFCFIQVLLKYYCHGSIFSFAPKFKLCHFWLTVMMTNILWSVRSFPYCPSKYWPFLWFSVLVSSAFFAVMVNMLYVFRLPSTTKCLGCRSFLDHLLPLSITRLQESPSLDYLQNLLLIVDLCVTSLLRSIFGGHQAKK